MRKPKYCHHKETGQARVFINRKAIYLGKHDSPESHAKFDAVTTQWLRHHSDKKFALTVGELCLLFMEHAEAYYRKTANRRLKSVVTRSLFDNSAVRTPAFSFVTSI